MHFLLLFLLLTTLHTHAQNQWTWINGDQTVNNNGRYGTQGTPSPSNIPGSRFGAGTWTDRNGNFWLFGGQGNGESFSGPLNDLWRYNPGTQQWTWISGGKLPRERGVYGREGESSPNIFPGARENPVTWVDNQGNFWLFGGLGYGRERNDDDDDDNDNRSIGLLNDLWRYSPASNKWTYISGSDRIDQRGRYGRRSREARSNRPGGRYMSSAWKDNAGNLWLFGGNGFSSERRSSDLNDVWKFSISSGRWTWMKGDDSDDADARYGNKGQFENRNTPGGRRGATTWTDINGTFWMFGGGDVFNRFSDLWKYNPSSNEWAWISGSNSANTSPQFNVKGQPDVNGNPGARMHAVGWADNRGDLWLFGGSGYGGLFGNNALNSLWKYSSADNSWTFVKGETAIITAAVYGTQGTPAENNTPGGTTNAFGWRDNQGNLWIFGGQSLLGRLNQLWKFNARGCGENISGTISPANSSICQGGSQILTATGGTSYEWRKDGNIIPGQTAATYTATQSGTYSVIIKSNGCSVPASNTAVVTNATTPKGSISPATATICENGTQVLTATGGTSYTWHRNGSAIAGHTSAKLTVSEPGTYTVIIANGTCIGPASNSAVVKLGTAPTGSITPSNTFICEGVSQTLTATGGSSYEWSRNGELIAGQTNATLTVTSPGTYSVLIKEGNCSGPASNTATVELQTTNGIRYPNKPTAPGKPVQLLARLIGERFEWTPRTGLNNPMSATPVATINAEQEYIVHITTEAGCLVRDTVLVTVSTDSKLHMPTAFTPDGNNINDLLRPLGNFGTIDIFKVYNRWGNLVYQSTEGNAAWDGRYKGVAQPADTYTWVIVGKSPDGKPFSLSGKTLLIR